MSQKLSQRPEESVRQFLVDNLRSGEMEGYDPQQTNRQETDFLPVTTDWSTRGEYYPLISIREQDSPQVPNSGNTGYNGQQGDGSGPNIYNIKNITVSCQATEGGAYLNSVDYDELVFTLYQEVQHQIQTNATTGITEAQWLGVTPPTYTRDAGEDGGTGVFMQAQGTINFGYIDSP